MNTSCVTGVEALRLRRLSSSSSSVVGRLAFCSASSACIWDFMMYPGGSACRYLQSLVFGHCQNHPYCFFSMASRKNLQMISVGRLELSLACFCAMASSSFCWSHDSMPSSSSSSLRSWKRSILAALRSTARSWEYLHLKPFWHLPCLKNSHSTDFGSTPAASLGCLIATAKRVFSSASAAAALAASFSFLAFKAWALARAVAASAP
mmetsp:Transcript_36324/g.50455  ORF Transcript_36324/g.50455 Transcript_36324/m.50455 type:complete len:207 (+) Transcript_36324:509-1129(+)